MDTKGAEEKLEDYLDNGIAVEIIWADRAFALAKEIGKHAREINAANFGELFGSFQIVLSDRQTLAATKLLDQPKKYATRSIPGTLDLLECHASLWRIRDREKIYQALTQGGRDTSQLDQLRDDELTHFLVDHFRSTLPNADALQQSRDKQIAHNEAIEQSALQSPTWGEALTLINYAKDFLTTIGYGFLGKFYGSDRSDYLLTNEIKRTVDDLRRLLTYAGIPGDS
jgi:AbiU2